MAAAALAVGVPVVSAGSASAFGGEYVGCTITPGGFSTPGNPSYCESDTPATSFGITFSVNGGSGSYSYAWSVPSSLHWSIWGGCTSTSSTCTLTADGMGHDNDIVVSVVVTQGSQQETLSGEASTAATCHFMGGLILC
jgi:hypothetical protein